MAKTEKTAEQIAEQKKQNEEKNAARTRILQFLKDNADQLGSLADDIRLFVHKAPMARTGLPTKSVNAEIREAILNAGDTGLTEMDIFRQFRIGRPEMTTKIRILVLCPNPADRVWVKFFEDTETYKVVGLGANPPDGWDGYIPSAKNSL